MACGDGVTSNWAEWDGCGPVQALLFDDDVQGAPFQGPCLSSASVCLAVLDPDVPPNFPFFWDRLHLTGWAHDENLETKTPFFPFLFDSWIQSWKTLKAVCVRH